MVLPDISTFQLSHKCEFTSINGNECLLEIYRRPVDYFWKVMEITGQSNPVTIEFGNSGGSIFDTLRAKTLIFNFYSETNNKYNEFFEGELYSYYCKFYINSILEFQGWMLPDIHNEHFTTPPFELSVKFGCGLFLLKDNFVDNPFTVGSPLKFIREALAFTAFNLNILDFVHIYEQSMLSLIGLEKLATLKQLFIGWEPLFEMSYYDALKKILQSFCCEMYQYKGEWLIKRNDVSTTEITGVRYSQSTGLIIDALDLHFNKEITVYNEAIADRLCWIGGDQSIQFEPAYKELNLKIPKELTENFFITGNDFTKDYEFNNPDSEYPTPAQIKNFTSYRDFYSGNLWNAYRYWQPKLLDSNEGALFLKAGGWKYNFADNCRLDMSIKASGYINNAGVFRNGLYFTATNTFLYAVPGAILSNNQPIVFDRDFGIVKGNKVYYINSVTNGTYGSTFKISYDRDSFNQLGQISTEDMDSIQINVSPAHVSIQMFMFKSFSLATQWVLSNDGNWYSLAATGNNYLSVDLYIDLKDIELMSTELKVIELIYAGINVIPDDGYLYYRAKGVNTDGVINLYFESLKFTLKQYKTYGNIEQIIEFPDNLDVLSIINQSEKETYDYTITFTDTPDLLNPHLIYKNWLSCIDIRTKSDSWFLDFDTPVYKSHYEHIRYLITLQISKRKAILKGTLTSLGDVIGFNIMEKNYFDLYFKNVYCNFNPKFETYNGEWIELKQPLVKTKIPLSEFDVDFYPINYN